ncbi:group II intron reverse transcriptase/maturase [Halorhodospira halophila]|nr:group II intron reverse transcriptase/maturase [Halorhodospira halophila]MBK5937658.1 group II intron reverse transcriptase/maturase [Halorhodospira halophila]
MTGDGLPTPQERVRTLQTSLQAKAKAEPAFRFYSLWDKVCRFDVLYVAYRRCRRNGGQPGVDGERFQDIEAQGLNRWLETLQEELRAKRYEPQPLRRTWIPKASGGQRPLGIPTVRDRVVQMAVHMVLAPIFDPDLLSNQYAFRPGLDAKMAVRRVYWLTTEQGRTEVVDLDLRDYFNTIPHGALLKCVRRRVADGTVLGLLKAWLEAPIVEQQGRSTVRTTPNKDTHRGTPQGGVISPLLANLYMRRFVLAWRQLGFQQRYQAHPVTYADDVVLCCRPGYAAAAREAAQRLFDRLGLTVNADKTRVVGLPEEYLDFLGYTLGRFYAWSGRPYLGTAPSKKAVKRLRQEIREATSPKWYWDGPMRRVKRISKLLQGWAGYFDQGPVIPTYERLQDYTNWRVRRWLLRRQGRKGNGYRRYPDAYLYEVLGLFQFPRRRADLPSAKACDCR